MDVVPPLSPSQRIFGCSLFLADIGAKYPFLRKKIDGTSELCDHETSGQLSAIVHVYSLGKQNRGASSQLVLGCCVDHAAIDVKRFGGRCSRE